MSPWLLFSLKGKASSLRLPFFKIACFLTSEMGHLWPQLLFFILLALSHCLIMQTTPFS